MPDRLACNESAVVVEVGLVVLVEFRRVSVSTTVCTSLVAALAAQKLVSSGMSCFNSPVDSLQRACHPRPDVLIISGGRIVRFVLILFL